MERILKCCAVAAVAIIISMNLHDPTIIFADSDPNPIIETEQSRDAYGFVERTIVNGLRLVVLPHTGYFSDGDVVSVYDKNNDILCSGLVCSVYKDTFYVRVDDANCFDRIKAKLLIGKNLPKESIGLYNRDSSYSEAMKKYSNYITERNRRPEPDWVVEQRNQRNTSTSGDPKLDSMVNRANEMHFNTYRFGSKRNDPNWVQQEQQLNYMWEEINLRKKGVK